MSSPDESECMQICMMHPIILSFALLHTILLFSMLTITVGVYYLCYHHPNSIKFRASVGPIENKSPVSNKGPIHLWAGS